MRFSILFLALFCSISLAAQSDKKTESNKKVIVVKKKNVNGKITEEKIEAHGSEADRLIQKMRNERDFEGINIVNKEVKVKVINGQSGDSTESENQILDEDLQIETTVDKSGNTVTTYTLLRNINGKVKKIVWDGNGEPPMELQNVLDKTEIQTYISNDSSKTIKVLVQDGIDIDIDESIEIEIEETVSNSAVLGVNIIDRGKGVIVQNVLDNSGAQKAGIRKNDIILKIDNEYIFTSTNLLEKLRPFSANDEIKLTVLRNGKELDFNVILQKM